tara:strand:- start:83185 stop:83520 length:336 start_codon:yes stop_codon:yes gene_type:complete
MKSKTFLVPFTKELEALLCLINGHADVYAYAEKHARAVCTFTTDDDLEQHPHRVIEILLLEIDGEIVLLENNVGDEDKLWGEIITELFSYLSEEEVAGLVEVETIQPDLMD